MATEYNLYIEQGADYRKVFRRTAGGHPIDMTGCTARMHIRRHVRSEEVWLDLTTENGRLIIDGAAGQIEIDLSEEDTRGLLARNGVYDLEIVDSDGRVIRFLEGTVEVSAEVTRQEAP